MTDKEISELREIMRQSDDIQDRIQEHRTATLLFKGDATWHNDKVKVLSSQLEVLTAEIVKRIGEKKI